MSDKKLYPIKFIPVQAHQIWGNESWKIADLGYLDSIATGGWLEENSIGDIMETYLERMVGDECYNYYGRQFPLCAKIISTGNMASPVFVCPDDQTASERYDSLGKEKFWYVMDAEEDSELYIGFSEDVTASQVYDACKDGSLTSYMNVLKPRKGDFLRITPGTVHGIGRKCCIAEISESSALDMMIFNWGRAAASEDEVDSLEEAFDFIDFKKYEAREKSDIFTVSEIKLDNPLKSTSGASESPYVYLCASGEAGFITPDGSKCSIKAGEALIVPAETSLYSIIPASEGTVLLEAVPLPRVENDVFKTPETDVTVS